jgi:hypothetical protein
MEPSADPPSLPILFPSTAVADVDDVLVQGVICPGGSPEVDLENADVSCVGGDEPRQLVSYSIHIERDGASNMNPTIPADAFTFAGTAWNESTAPPPATGCATTAGTPELPLATRSDATESGFDSMGNEVPQEIIGITGDDADRESYVNAAGNEKREDLVYAHYTTVGEPARLFSVVDDRTPNPELKWSYPAPDELSSDGTLVRVFFTLIDQRGGTHWTTRYFCAVP